MLSSIMGGLGLMNGRRKGVRERKRREKRRKEREEGRKKEEGKDSDVSYPPPSHSLTPLASLLRISQQKPSPSTPKLSHWNSNGA